MTLFLCPHGDDVPLFCAFPLWEHRDDAHIIIAFDSYIQPARGIPNCSVMDRVEESIAAYKYLLPDTAGRIHFLKLRDDMDYNADLERWMITLSTMLKQFDDGKCEVYCPLGEDHGHVQHNLVTMAAVEAFGVDCRRLRRYTTYTRTGGRTRTSTAYPVPSPDALVAKHRALACYRSQMQPETGCQPWFLSDLNEYIIHPDRAI